MRSTHKVQWINDYSSRYIWYICNIPLKINKKEQAFLYTEITIHLWILKVRIMDTALWWAEVQLTHMDLFPAPLPATPPSSIVFFFFRKLGPIFYVAHRPTYFIKKPWALHKACFCPVPNYTTLQMKLLSCSVETQ